MTKLWFVMFVFCAGAHSVTRAHSRDEVKAFKMDVFEKLTSLAERVLEFTKSDESELSKIRSTLKELALRRKDFPHNANLGERTLDKPKEDLAKKHEQSVKHSASMASTNAVPVGVEQPIVSMAKFAAPNEELSRAFNAPIASALKQVLTAKKMTKTAGAPAKKTIHESVQSDDLPVADSKKAAHAAVDTSIAKKMTKATITSTKETVGDNVVLHDQEVAESKKGIHSDVGTSIARVFGDVFPPGTLTVVSMDGHSSDSVENAKRKSSGFQATCRQTGEICSPRHLLFCCEDLTCDRLDGTTYERCF